MYHCEQHDSGVLHAADHRGLLPGRIRARPGLTDPLPERDPGAPAGRVHPLGTGLQDHRGSQLHRVGHTDVWSRRLCKTAHWGEFSRYTALNLYQLIANEVPLTLHYGFEGRIIILHKNPYRWRLQNEAKTVGNIVIYYLKMTLILIEKVL